MVPFFGHCAKYFEVWFEVSCGKQRGDKLSRSFETWRATEGVTRLKEVTGSRDELLLSSECSRKGRLSTSERDRPKRSPQHVYSVCSD